jgi:hypothetical protein
MSRDYVPNIERRTRGNDASAGELRERDREPDSKGRGRSAPPFPDINHLDPRRSAVQYRGESYSLRASDVSLMQTVGTFRVVYASDLRTEHPSLDRDVRSLREQGLVTSTTHLDKQGQRREILALTPAARDLLCAAEDGKRQYYAGLVKRRELGHDASLFALYRQHVQALRARGAEAETVHLDHALKHALWSREATGDTIEERAANLGLPYDAERGVQIPDLQIVVREPDGQLSRANIELVTAHYSRSTNRAKRAAGFHLYTEDTQARGRAEDRDLAAQFLVL